MHRYTPIHTRNEIHPHKFAYLFCVTPYHAFWFNALKGELLGTSRYLILGPLNLRHAHLVRLIDCPAAIIWSRILRPVCREGVPPSQGKQSVP